MNELIKAYISDAGAFALIHVALILICFFLWAIDRRRLIREMRSYNNLQLAGSLNLQTTPSSSIESLAQFASSLAQKGSMPDAETLRRRLINSLSTSDATLRTCINGLVVVGLLGTLFNLWHLGPGFWNSLIEGNALQSKSAIGVAFAASFFGLLWAFTLNLLDNAIFRRRREVFVREATIWITSKTVEQLPHSREAAVTQGLNKFIKASETILLDLKTQHATLTQHLLDQIRDSSQALDISLNSIASRWQTFLTDSTAKVKEGGKEIQSAAKQLTDATNHASKTLADTTKTLESYKNLSELIAEVRTESAKLVSEVTQRMEQFSRQMEINVSNVAKEHSQALEQESEAANKRLSDLMDAWHTRSAATLGGFGANIQKASDDFSANWQQLSSSVYSQVDQLIRSWRMTLDASVGDMNVSLKSVNEQLKKTERLSEALLKSAQALVRATEALPDSSPKSSDHAIRELLRKLDVLPNQIAQAVSGNRWYRRWFS